MDSKHLAWYNPDDAAFYRGSLGSVANSDFVAKKGLKEVEGRFMRAAEQSLSGGIFDTPDSSTIKAVVVLDQVLGTTFRDYRLREMCQIINSPQLVLSVDLATKFDAATRILPLEEAKVAKQAYARTTFDLAAAGKNVAHILLADESEKQAVHDVFRLHVDNAARALMKAENSQLQAIIEGGTSVATSAYSGGAWNTMNGNADFSHYNPLLDLEGVYDLIWQNGFKPDTIGLHPKVFAALRSNTYVRYFNQDAGALSNVSPNLAAVGYPDLQVVTDPDLTATMATVMSKSAGSVVLAAGPTEAAQYRDEIRGADGYVIRQWTLASIINQGGMRSITAAYA